MLKESVVNLPKPGQVDLEGRARLSKHFIENAVDPQTGQPYFTVFQGDLTSFCHDWPDFGDLTARYWEACYMINDMTGELPQNTDTLRDLLFDYFEKDGLSYRPITPYSLHFAEIFDQGRTLGALCSVFMATGDETISSAIQRMVDGLMDISVTEGGYRFIPGSRYAHGEWLPGWDNSGYFVGPLIRPLVKAYELLDYQPALDLAADLARYVIEKAGMFGSNGEFSDHVHSRLATAAGVFSCGVATHNKEWMNLARKSWEFAREKSGPCGFVPEYIAEYVEHFRSETCAIMDYLDLTMLLASAGDESKWGQAEKIVRNHLIESQCIWSDWAKDNGQEVRDEVSFSGGVGERMLGGFAGWSAFDYYFGVMGFHNEGWLNTEVARNTHLNSRRAFQNCCGPAGLRALYLAWSKSLVWQGDGLKVNLLFNRRIEDAEIRVNESEAGTLVVSVKADRSCVLSVRLPDWCDPASVVVTLNGSPVQFALVDQRVKLSGLHPGARVEIKMPLNEYHLDYAVQHRGFDPEVFDVAFKGDSAVAVTRVSGGLSPERKLESSVLADAYPLYQRNAGDVYVSEPTPRESDGSINWFH